MIGEETIHIAFRIPSRLADFIEDWLVGAVEMLDRHWRPDDTEPDVCYGVGGNVRTGWCELSIWGRRAPEYVQEAVRTLVAHGAEVGWPRREHWTSSPRIG